MMFGHQRRVTSELVQRTSDLLVRVQRLEEEQASVRRLLDGERQLRVFTAHIGGRADWDRDRGVDRAICRGAPNASASYSARTSGWSRSRSNRMALS